MNVRILPLALFGITSLATAATWTDYKAVFPALPCLDGWSACLVGSASVSPNTVNDGAGRPHPADMRIGFFDLDPLPGLSPFGGLSMYTGELPASAKRAPAQPAGDVAQAEPTQAEPTQAEPTQAEPTQAEPRGQGDVASAGNVDLDEEARATEALNRQAAEARAQRSGGTPPSTASNPSSTPPTSTPPSTARTTPPPTTTTTPPPATTTTPPSTARTTPPPTTTTPPPTTTAPPVADMAAPDDNTCDDLVALEAPAMMGQLGPGRRKCLEARMNAEGSQTTKNKMSRVLMADAEARRDQADWERLIKNHLENIDRSDPNLCLKYSIFLARGGVGKSSQVIRWADYAMENKQQWSGPTYTKNVYALYKLKAQAANALWQDAEKEFVENRSDETQAKSDKYRGMTKNFSLEWLTYARASGQDTTAPMAICVSSAGNKEFCE